jgi:excisionase family DNA binding protein
MVNPSVNEPVTITVPTAIALSGLGRTKLYEMISSGEIESVLVGTRRLIVFASLRARLTGNHTSNQRGSGSDAHR